MLGEAASSRGDSARARGVVGEDEVRLEGRAVMGGCAAWRSFLHPSDSCKSRMACSACCAWRSEEEHMLLCRLCRWVSAVSLCVETAMSNAIWADSWRMSSTPASISWMRSSWEQGGMCVCVDGYLPPHFFFGMNSGVS